MLASLNHPHIGAIYGVEQSDGVPVLILELVEGPTLADRLAKGPIPLTESLGIASQIVDALDAAHERGIVHRDLTPFPSPSDAMSLVSSACRNVRRSAPVNATVPREEPSLNTADA